MNFFGQRRPEWANVKLGKTNRTIAQVGCTTCCVAMASSYYGCEKNPPSLASKLDYTADALILWGSIERETCFKLLTRFYGLKKDVIADGLKDPAKTVILNVANGGHWVFALKSLPFNQYWVYDPWNDRKTVYGGVVGGAVFLKK